MNNDDLEIIIAGGAGWSAAGAADHIALALMGAGASVDFPGRPNREARSGQTLRGCGAATQGVAAACSVKIEALLTQSQPSEEPPGPLPSGRKKRKGWKGMGGVTTVH